MDLDEWAKSMAPREKETAFTQWRDCMRRAPPYPQYDAETADYLRGLHCSPPVDAETIAAIERQRLKEDVGATIFLALMVGVIAAGWRAVRRSRNAL